MEHNLDGVDVWALPSTKGLSVRNAIHLYMHYLRKILSKEELMALVDTKAREVRAKHYESEEEYFALRYQCWPERDYLQSRVLMLGDAIEDFSTNFENTDRTKFWLEWMIQEIVEWRQNTISRDGLGAFSEFELDFDEPKAMRDHLETVRVINKYWDENEGWALSYRLIFDTRTLRQAMIIRIESIIDALGQSTAEVHRAHNSRMKWKVSISAFAFIFKELAKKGYFELPPDRGREGDSSNTEWARILLQSFDLPKKDGTIVTPENLRQRLSDSEPHPLAEAKQLKFSIPEASELD